MIKALVLLLLAQPAFCQWRPVNISSNPKQQEITENFRRAALWSNRKVDKYSAEGIYGAYNFHNSITISTDTTVTGSMTLGSSMTVSGQLLVNSTITAYSAVLTDDPDYKVYASTCGGGGTITTYTDSEGYTNCVYSFTGTGTFNTPTGLSQATALLRGGGGNGGAGNGGGGGGGEVKSVTVSVSGSMSVVVGAGASANSTAGTSTFGGESAIGGGNGGSSGVGGSGANGGGGSPTGGGGTGTVGYNGGAGNNSGDDGGGGGGGGMGGIGSAADWDGLNEWGGNGGIGYASSITGTSVKYGAGGGGAANPSYGGKKGYGGGSYGNGNNGGGYETQGPNIGDYSNCTNGTADGTGNGGGGSYGGGTYGCAGSGGGVTIAHRILEIPYRTILTVDGDISAHNIVATSSMNATAFFGNAAKVTGAGGDISGVYDSIEVSSDSHQHSMQTLVGVRASTDTLVGDVTGTYTATVVGDDSHNHNLTTVNTSTINAKIDYLMLGISTAAGLPNNNTFTGINTFTSSVTVQSVGVKTGTYPTTITTGNQTDYLSWILPTSTGTIEQFLTSDGSGNLSWQAPSVPGEQSYYFSAENSDITGYYNMYSTYPYTSAIASTVTFTSSLASVNIGTWTTLSGYPSNPIIPEGTWGIHFHANKTAGTKDIRLYGKFYKRSSGGVFTFLGTSENSAILTSAITSYNIHFYSTGTILDTGDRVVAEAWATITGGGTDPNISIYFGGLYFSAMTLPAPSVSIANFVPYNGATKLLNMNGYGVTTSSNVTAASFIGSGASLTGVITSTAQIVSIQNAHTAALSTAAYLVSTQTFTGNNTFEKNINTKRFFVGSTNAEAAASLQSANTYYYTQVIGSSDTTLSGGLFVAGDGWPTVPTLGPGDVVINHGTSPTASIRFANHDNTERMRIGNNGAVVIASSLTVSGAAFSVAGSTTLSVANGITTIGSSTTISGSSVTLLGAVTVANNVVSVSGAGTNSFAGRVGVGFTGATGGNSALEVASANQLIGSYGNVQVRSSDSFAVNKGGQITFSGSYTGTTRSSFASISGRKENSTDGDYLGYMAFATEDVTSMAERMRITSAGRVGIGTTAPASKLHISTGTIHIDGTGSPTTGGALCLNASGNMAKCTSAIDASGNCTCP